MSSLLKFDPPTILGSDGAAVRRPKPLKLQQSKPTGGVLPAASRGASSSGAAAGLSAAGERRRLPPLEDILASIFPPMTATDPETGVTTVQAVSAAPSSRLDAIRLQEALDERLTARDARESGICAVRSELYAQTLDELIRQVTVDCPEQGLMLLRIRDEAHATLDAYRALYESSVEFGTRKSLVANTGKPQLKKTIAQLQQDKLQLELQVLTLQQQCEEIDAQAQLQRAAKEKAHADEINFFRKTNHQLATQLKSENDKTHARKQ